MAAVKLVVWDLDETLWAGTLADGDTVAPFPARVALIHALNAAGVVNSICSKNDPAAAQDALRAHGLWDAFVFPHIAFAPKAEALRSLIAAMQLRPANVLFIDDNRLNLESARAALPDLQILDATDPQTDTELHAILAAQPAGARSRLAEYRALEAKWRDRAAFAPADATGDADEAFLRGCDIHACAPFLMDNLDFAPRIAELINRSNQLNYTSSRVEPDALAAAIIDVVAYDSWSIFAWDRYGDYGLVGFCMVDRRSKALIHFTFSCRVMHMGLERYAIAQIRQKQPQTDFAVLAGRVPLTPVDWVRDVSFHAPDVRARLIAMLRPDAADTAQDIRVMFDCQSGGIAHFSQHRARMDFDNAPRLFALRHILPGCTEHEGLPDPTFAPLLIYGTGVDYSDPRWKDLVDLVQDGSLFAGCVQLLCQRVAQEGAHMLVILPPEDAPDGHYRPHMGHTRARTALFNQIWRYEAAAYPQVTLFELTGFADASDMPDVSHYYAGFLQRLAGVVDDWISAQGRLTQPQTHSRDAA
ncbi:hypothetical protein GTZ99_02560 [Novosphingobium sp. FSY-8]|uniref:FkbH-like protein n=1 Tax=Novosphingobium ovatum TaxID=1908523 RepID=A0ABW9XA80_9SPHN|nr:HAD family hydrolase [Novosphingobium ovatum]NBC35435.1 hypothetical protein [Novosphingobium ovatum]